MKQLYALWQRFYVWWRRPPRQWNVPPSSPAAWYDDYDAEAGDQISVDEDL